MANDFTSAMLLYIRLYADQWRDIPAAEREVDDKRIVPESNVWMTRVGAVIRKKVSRRYFFLLGSEKRKIHHVCGAEGGHGCVDDLVSVEPDGGCSVIQPAYSYKTPGGYMILDRECNGYMDVSSLDTLSRETLEENFRRQNSLIKQRVTPLAVIRSPARGVMQFFSAELRRNPNRGRYKDAFFKRGRDADIMIRWANIEQVTTWRYDDKVAETVAHETAMAIAASYFFTRGKRLEVREQGIREGRVTLSDGVVKMIKRRTGLGWFPDRYLQNCEIWYNKVITPGGIKDELFSMVPAVNVFFQVGPFMYQKDIWRDDIEGILGGKNVPHSNSAGKLVSAYVKRNMREVLHERLLEDYLVDRSVR